MADYVCFKDETLILTAAGLGHQQVVETLIKATTDISEGDKNVCHIASITIFSSFFALLVTNITPLRPLICTALVAIYSVYRQCKKYLCVCFCDQTLLRPSPMPLLL